MILYGIIYDNVDSYQVAVSCMSAKGSRLKKHLVLAAVSTLLLSQLSLAKTLEWSGYEWHVKTSEEPFGPGPNMWSDAGDSVWVDGQDRLHLKIRNINGQWHCAEVMSTKSLGHGQYIFYLDSRVDNLNANIAAGLFVHSDDQNEIDIEFSKWGQERRYTHHQFVLQPRIDDTNLHRSDWRVKSPRSTHGFIWSNDEVRFRSFTDHVIKGKRAIKRWNYAGPNNPVPNNEKVHINLWLYKGAPPTDGSEAILVVSKFIFVPLADLNRKKQKDAMTAIPKVNWDYLDQ